MQAGPVEQQQPLFKPEPWQIWCHGWNRYTKRRFDAGLPIIQRILAERKKPKWFNASSSPIAISEDGGKTWIDAEPIRPTQASPDNETRSTKYPEAAKSAQAGGLKGTGNQIPHSPRHYWTQKALEILKGLFARS